MNYKPLKEVIDFSTLNSIIESLDFYQIVKLLDEDVKKIRSGIYVVRRKTDVLRPHYLYVLFDQCCLKLYYINTLGFDAYSLQGLLYLVRGKVAHNVYYRKYLLQVIKYPKVQREVIVSGSYRGFEVLGHVDFVVLYGEDKESEELHVIELKSSENVGRGAQSQALLYSSLLEYVDKTFVVSRSKCVHVEDKRLLDEAISLFKKVIDRSDPPIEIQSKIKERPPCLLCGFKFICEYYLTKIRPLLKKK